MSIDTLKLDHLMKNPLSYSSEHCWYDKCDHCKRDVGETNLVTVSNDDDSPDYGKAVCEDCMKQHYSDSH